MEQSLWKGKWRARPPLMPRRHVKRFAQARAHCGQGSGGGHPSPEHAEAWGKAGDVGREQ